MAENRSNGQRKRAWDTTNHFTNYLNDDSSSDLPQPAAKTSRFYTYNNDPGRLDRLCPTELDSESGLKRSVLLSSLSPQQQRSQLQQPLQLQSPQQPESAPLSQSPTPALYSPPPPGPALGLYHSQRVTDSHVLVSHDETFPSDRSQPASPLEPTTALPSAASIGYNNSHSDYTTNNQESKNLNTKAYQNNSGAADNYDAYYTYTDDSAFAGAFAGGRSPHNNSATAAIARGINRSATQSDA